MVLCHIMQMIFETAQTKEKTFAQKYMLEKELKIFKRKTCLQGNETARQ